MYKDYFLLKEKPFSLTSNPAFLYLSHRHEEALSHLLYGIHERVGFIEVTGEVGTGKTTLCKALLNRLDKSVKTAYIFNSYLSERQLIQTILEDLGIHDSSKKNRADLFGDLNRFLIKQLAANQNVVLIVDEAQNLSRKLLEQIRMLSNLEAENEKLIQIVLVGQPELREKLNAPDLRQLRQRIAIRYHIKPLDKEEVDGYIRHRLKKAGANGTAPLFVEEAVGQIFDYSQGIPRLINVLCDKALLMGYVKGRQVIGPDMIQHCVDEIEGGVS